MNEVLQAMKNRFSTRGYTAEKLTEEELKILTDAGMQAPTAANRQEIHFTVLDGDNPLLLELQEEVLKDRPNMKPGTNFYYGAPTLIILSGEEAFGWAPVDAGIAVQNIALAAESLGLGSLIIGCVKGALTGEKREYFSKALKLPEGYVYQVASAVGHKAASKEPHEYSAEKNVTCL